MNLNGKIVLVTGASRGIGRACALKLAEKGAVVVINYFSNKKNACEVKDTIVSNGGKAIIIKADVSSLDDVKNMFESIEDQFGSVEILVNNAGITKDSLLVRMKEEQWDDVIATNLKSVFNCCRTAVKKMIKLKRGRIINITSIVGINGNSGQTNYAASKAGIIGFSKSLAKEIANRNILVNCIAPGFINTEMTEVLNEKVKENILSTIPLGVLGNPDDIADAVCFLASSYSSYITGQVINVDGGMSM
jgi:3-oxoacyl-[acyl-carrier protein] reductase